MHGFLTASLAICFALVARVSDAQPQRSGPATIILTGGKVFTGDTAHAWVEALAIRGERVMAVGATADIRRLAARGTREIRLDGRVVIPGINDAHDHLGESGLGPEFRMSTSPTPDPSTVELLDSLHTWSARTPAGTWLRTQVGPRILLDTTVDRTTLDRVAPAHPVMVQGWWGHGMVLNSSALDVLGITDTVTDPLGGWYGRAADGRLNGRLNEYARWSTERRLGATRPERVLVAALRAFADSSLRMGVTSVQDMAGYLPPGLTVRLFREAQLPLRVRLVRLSMPTATSMNTVEWDTVATPVARRVVVEGRKWIVEGTPIEQLALRRTAYQGRPGWYGRLNIPVDTLRAILAAALRPGAPQLHLHIVGDSTAKLVLDAMEALAPDSVWRTRRVRFEHGNPITGPQIPRAKRLGIVIAQPRPGASLRSWRAAGIPVAYGSDMLRNPYVNMLAAVTGAGHPDEAISREEAVRIYTSGSAFAERAEKAKGMLAPGMLADVAVLSQDLFTVPTDALPATRSVLTIIGGKIVYDGLSRGDMVGQTAWQPSLGHTQIPIWPGAVPDARPVERPEVSGTVVDATGSKKLVGGRPWVYVDRVSQPTMTVYSPVERNTGAAVVVFPGGGYNVLAIDLEGTEACDWLTSRGITCVLLKYRVPCVKSGPYQDCRTALQDAQRTVGLVRFHSARWHVDPHKIGVLGFSAGGHMVAAMSTHFDKRLYPTVDAADTVSCRPDFAIALYPGHLAIPERGSALNPDIQVTRRTPPTFLLQAEDDPTDPVENSLVYYAALRKAGIPAEMHVYVKGGHAFGLRRTTSAITDWPALVENWLGAIGMISK